MFLRWRSIRKYTDTPISDEILLSLIEAGRMSPSASNAQPWRFKIVTDVDTKSKVACALFNQQFVVRAPAIIVCCADVKSYIADVTRGAIELENEGVAKPNVVGAIISRNAEMERRAEQDETVYEIYALKIAINVAVAAHSIQLAAMSFGLGSCWLGALGNEGIRRIFGWGDELYPVAVLALGFPAENPRPRSRKTLEELLL